MTTQTQNDQLTLFGQHSQLEGAFLSSYSRQRKVSRICGWIYQFVLWSALGVIGFHLWNHHSIIQGENSLDRLHLQQSMPLRGSALPFR